MTLHEKIRSDYMKCMKLRGEDLEYYRFLLGELSRGKSKEVDDNTLISIFQKLKKSFSDEFNAKRMGENEYLRYLGIFNQFIPQEATEEEITLWISENINFTNYPNKMASMKTIMTHFGKTADGNVVKNILSNL